MRIYRHMNTQTKKFKHTEDRQTSKTNSPTFGRREQPAVQVARGDGEAEHQRGLRGHGGGDVLQRHRRQVHGCAYKRKIGVT